MEVLKGEEEKNERVFLSRIMIFFFAFAKPNPKHQIPALSFTVAAHTRVARSVLQKQSNSHYERSNDQ